MILGFAYNFLLFENNLWNKSITEGFSAEGQTLTKIQNAV